MSFPYITTSYENGTSGYIVFSNKLCIQWGHSSNKTVSLMKAYKNTNYVVHATGMPSDRTGTGPMASNLDVDCGSLTKTTFQYYQYNTNYQADWTTIGFIA
ncbi:MAG: hypothetical protein J6Q89_05545 [Clostridia bacterium]|nr:hypothetical protein [Clostridia bacterium]